MISEHDFLNVSAIAAELAGRFYLGCGMARIGEAYLVDAFRDYQRWGVATKANDLMLRYSFLRGRMLHYTASETSTSITASHSTSEISVGGMIDIGRYCTY